MKFLHGVYCNYNEDNEGEQLVSIHETEDGANKNKEAQTDYSQEYYYVDTVIVHK